MRYFLLPLLLLSLSLSAHKVEEANRSVVSVVAYDAQGKILSTGNGYFCSERADVAAPYSLLRGASRADIIDWKGRRYAALRIVGASEHYDLVRFTTTAPNNKLYSLAPRSLAADTALTPISQCFYSNEKKEHPLAVRILRSEPMNAYAYYQVSTPNAARYAGCPLIDAQGAVVGMTQLSVKQDDPTAYAIDARLIDSLRVTSASVFNADLRAIHIAKQLPTTSESEAYSYLYMLLLSGESRAVKLTTISDFRATYPNNAELPFELANFYAREGEYPLADAQLRPIIAGQDERAARAASQLAQLMYIKHSTDSTAHTEAWNLDAALSLAQRADSLQPTAQRALQVGQLLIAQHRRNEALAACQQALNRPDASWQAYSTTAELTALLGGSTDSVLALYDSCVARIPKPYTKEAAQAIFYHAVFSMEAGKLRQAAESFEQYETILGIRSLDANFYTLRSKVYLQARMYQQAVDDATTAVSRCTDAEQRQQAQLTLAQLYLSLGEWASAQQCAEEVLATDNQNTDALKLIGVAYGERKQLSKARVYLQKASALGDEQAQSLLKRYTKR